MTDLHLNDHELIELALGDVGPGQSRALQHLQACRTCRSAYEEWQRTVDVTLAAAPSLAPSAGFDGRVLARLDLNGRRRRPFRVRTLVAAAAVIGLLLGGIGAKALSDGGASSASNQGAALVAGSGRAVGTIEPSQIDGRAVVVLNITRGMPGAHYTCRVTTVDGAVHDAGDWVMPASGQSTWIAYGTASRIARIDMVTDDGAVWSTARLG